MEEPDNSIPREQERNLTTAILESAGTVVVHAAGGVGKSIFSQRVKHYLPKGSVHIVTATAGRGVAEALVSLVAGRR